MRNSDHFLTAYNKIDDRLRQLTDLEREVPFSAVVNEAAQPDHSVRRYKDDLKELGELRNAIVHGREGERVIAEPHDETVEDIERIAELLINPPRVGDLFREDVFHLQSSEPIGKAVKVMWDESYSQIPVYDGESFVGLLTTNTVGRWLGACVEEEVFSLEETLIVDVLEYREYEDDYEFLSRRATLFEALDAFDPHKRQGKRLEAILITEHGKPEQSPLGIITVWDLPQIYQELAA